MIKITKNNNTLYAYSVINDQKWINLNKKKSHFLIITVFVSKKACNPSSPDYLPIPESLKPPNGKFALLTKGPWSVVGSKGFPTLIFLAIYAALCTYF